MSSPGYTSISAIVVLECPRSINPTKGQRNIALDGNFFVTEGSRTATLGFLHYFASEDMANEIRKIPEKKLGIQKAFIVANVRRLLFVRNTILRWIYLM